MIQIPSLDNRQYWEWVATYKPLEDIKISKLHPF